MILRKHVEMQMRRKGREVSQIADIEEILCKCKTCHVAMVDDGRPYAESVCVFKIESTDFTGKKKPCD